MNAKKITRSQLIKRYYGKYVNMLRVYDYATGQYVYEVRKAYNTIHEDTYLIPNDLD